MNGPALGEEEAEQGARLLASECGVGYGDIVPPDPKLAEGDDTKRRARPLAQSRQIGRAHV